MTVREAVQEAMKRNPGEEPEDHSVRDVSEALADRLLRNPEDAMNEKRERYMQKVKEAARDS